MPFYQRQKETRAGENEMADGITDSMDMNLGKLREIVRDRKVWSAAVYGVAKGQTWLSDWTTNATVIRLFLSPKTHVVFFKLGIHYLVFNMHLDVMRIVYTNVFIFICPKTLKKQVLFSPFYRKESVALGGRDGKRESWDGGLERETAGLCTATI